MHKLLNYHNWHIRSILLAVLSHTHTHTYTHKIKLRSIGNLPRVIDKVWDSDIAMSGTNICLFNTNVS